MKKRMKAIAIALIGAISLSMSVAATIYEQANKAFKLDTRSYTMAPGNINDFKVILKGGLTQKDVKVSDSRTGSIVKMTPVKNTDKYRITAVKEGTTFITAEVGGAHLSFKVDVKKGVKQGGQATYSNCAIVPDSYQPVNSNNSTTNNGVQPMYPNYAKPYKTEAIIADMVAEGKRLGMMHNPDFKITKIVNLESGGVEVSGGAGYRMPMTTVDYTATDPGWDNSYWLHKNCMEALQVIVDVGASYGGKPEDIRFNPVMLSEGNGDYLIYVFWG